MRGFFISLAFFLSAMSACAGQTQHVVWDKVPIVLHLPVGHERIVSFPGEVSVGYDVQVLSQETLRVQNANDTLYLLAKKSFPKTRIEVLLKAKHEIILLDIIGDHTVGQGRDLPLSVVLKTPVQEHPATLSKNEDEKMRLIRFAAQQLYAPQRLLSIPPSILRVAMDTERTVPLVRGGELIAMPLAQWKGECDYVTAVLLKNVSQTTFTLHPNQLQGQWLAATFFPFSQLSKAGSLHDQTTLFLVSDRPFNDRLKGALL